MSSRLLHLLVTQSIFFSLAFHDSCPTHTRKRRYLAFPDKSNLAITITLLKPTAFMNGVNTLHEIDLNVPLPKNPHRLIRRGIDGAHSSGSLERQVLYGQIESALDMYGLNGAGCLERVMCEVHQLKDEHLKKSFVLDLLKTIFTLPGLNFTKESNCNKSCEFSIFHPSLMMQK